MSKGKLKPFISKGRHLPQKKRKMILSNTHQEHGDRILRAGLSEEDVRGWLQAMETTDPTADRLSNDAARIGPLLEQGREFCNALPLKSKRSTIEREAGESLVEMMATKFRCFCRIYREQMYRALTDDLGLFLRADALCLRVSELWPGLLPTRQQLSQESQRMQKDKDGLEIHQGIFLSQVFSGKQTGLHLLHSMLRPKPDSLDLLEKFRRDGVVEIGHTRVEMKDGMGYMTTSNPRYLNAEDDSVNHSHEVAVDLILLHPDIQMGIIRGERVEHPRYKGRRVFDAGINLTKLYHGKISYMFYIDRDAGIYSKIYRGLTSDPWDHEFPEQTLEKPWLAAVDSFAIGGGCQLLLVVDYVIAESGAYFNLPARKEGIIPGAANMRLPRFLGERAARQGIMFDKKFYVDSPEAAGLINEVVPGDQMDAAVKRSADNALASGMVSASGNRKALRVQSEPLDDYRRYMAVYCEEQAYCHLSGQLISNLEKHWDANNRSLASDE